MHTSHDTSDNLEQQPWYRHGMVWMVIALPLAVVVASMVTISIAIDSAPVIIEKAPQGSAQETPFNRDESAISAPQN